MTCADAFLPNEADDRDSVARKHLRLCEHKDALAMVEAELVDVLHTLAGGKAEWEVDGKTIATTFKPTSPKVDGDALFRQVVAAAGDERMVDRETGEALESEGACVARVLAEVYPVCNASVKPRTTALKKRRIDLGEFQEVGGWVKTVRWL